MAGKLRDAAGARGRDGGDGVGGGRRGGDGARVLGADSAGAGAGWALAVTYEAESGVVEFTGAQGRRRQATVTLPAAGLAVAGAALVLDQAAPADPAGRGSCRCMRRR